LLKIYLDICCYNRPFDEQNNDLILLETEAKLIIQNNIKNGTYAFVWSFMLSSENDENPSDDKREIINSWGMLADEYCAASEDILSNAKQYMRLGLKHKDAIHLACAVKHKCDYFITTDKKLITKNNKINEINIVNPMVFILETEEFNEN